MDVDSWTAAKRVAAGIFCGLLVGAVVSWVTFTVLAAVLPKTVSPQRVACAAGGPAQRQGHRFAMGSCRVPGQPGMPGHMRGRPGASPGAQPGKPPGL